MEQEKVTVSINRIRLEFKVVIFVKKFIKHIVLIESDWNLKYNPGFSLQLPLMSVLIESDWNLKSISAWIAFTCSFCINRIRLEFKAETPLPRFSILACINRIRLEFKAD